MPDRVTGRRMIPIWALLAGALAAGPSQAAQKPVAIDLYVMSHCPFGIQAENGLLPAVKALGTSVDLRLNFIASVNPAGANGKMSFSSMHGATEVEEDLRQVCMMKHDPDGYLDYILERNGSSASGPDWQAAVSKAGGDPKAVQACAEGTEGAGLLSHSIDATVAKNVDSSPTIYLDGVAYAGARGQRSFTLALCAALKAQGAPQTQACKDADKLPADAPVGGGGGCGAGAAQNAQVEPVAFDMWVVTDKSCPECAATMLDPIKKIHPDVRVHEVDARSPEGQALIAKHRARALPLYVFDKGVEKDPAFASLANSYYAKSADQYVLRSGKDTYVPSVQLSRARDPRHLDIFVSPLSPYAVQAELELVKFLSESNIKDLTFSMHYRVQESVKADEKAAVTDQPRIRSASLEELNRASTELISPNGDAELRESLRQVCLFQHANIGDYFAYVTCRSSDLADESWGDSCLKPDDAIKKCMAGPEGTQLLRQDAKLERDLGIDTTVALFWENRYGPFGWNDVDWKSLIMGDKKLADR